MKMGVEAFGLSTWLNFGPEDRLLISIRLGIDLSIRLAYGDEGGEEYPKYFMTNLQ